MAVVPRCKKISNYIILTAMIFMAFFIFTPFASASDEEINIQLNDNEMAYISLPFGPSLDIAGIFSSFTASYKNSAYWDSNQGKYLFYSTNGFTSFDYLKGYWVVVRGASVNLKIKGSAPLNHSINLKKGYNAIGCPYNKPTPIEEALLPLKMYRTDITIDPNVSYYSAVYRYKSSSRAATVPDVSKSPSYYEKYSQDTQQFTQLRPGEGYWINMLVDGVWTVKNIPQPPADTTPPEIIITSPANNFITNQNPITFYYTVDGDPRQEQRNLSEGDNTITITAADGAGNIGSAQIKGSLICYDSQLVSQDMPANLYVNQTYNCRVTMKNTGNYTWTRSNSYKLGLLNSIDIGITRVELSDSDSISTNQQKDFYFQIKAPPNPGTYSFQWSMLRESVVWFGQWTNNTTVKVTAPVLSISVNPKTWDIGSSQINQTITMDQSNKITVTNDGDLPQTYELKLIDPPGWVSSVSSGIETYVLSGIFCKITDTPLSSHFNQMPEAEDVITTQPKRATQVVFASSQSSANGTNVLPGENRALYLQFKAPAVTSKKDQQEISVIISGQVP